MNQKKMLSGSFQLLLLCLILTNTYSQCPSDPVIETMHVDYEQYCSLVYDPCNNNSLKRCSKMYCPTGSDQCITTMELSTAMSCRRLCCKSSQDSINQDNPLSVKLCTASSGSNFNNEQSTSFVGGYVLIAVISSTFVLIFIVFCICKKYRSQQEDSTNPNYNSASPTAIIQGTCVDLNAYNINQEGPYFVNSKDSCAICLDNQVNLRTHCNHFYHGNCLLAWLKKKINNPCPLCMGINYNPVKVYCKECHRGDILVNIHSETNAQTIKEYDTYKCRNCKRSANSSFTLSDQGHKPQNFDESKKNQQTEEKGPEKQKIEQNSKNKEILSERSRRKPRNTQRLRKNQHKSAQQIQGNQIQMSAKELRQDPNKTQIFP